LFANAASFGLLWAYCGGDANMRSAWICTRNDVIGNLTVLIAAAGVFGTGTGWPDLIVAAIMAALALHGAMTVIGQSLVAALGSPEVDDVCRGAARKFLIRCIRRSHRNNKIKIKKSHLRHELRRPWC
jgi:Co/Zn/Cd efflux system component